MSIASTFVREKTEYGKTVKEVDLKSFVKALCHALGGTLSVKGEDEYYHRGSFSLGELLIACRKNYGANVHRITISAYPVDLDKVDQQSSFTWPETTVSAERSIDQIAKALKHKLINAAANPLAQFNAQYREEQSRNIALDDQIAQFSKKYPDVELRKEKGNYYATLWGRGERYFSGRLSANGEITVDRIAAVPADRVDAFFKAIL